MTLEQTKQLLETDQKIANVLPPQHHAYNGDLSQRISLIEQTIDPILEQVLKLGTIPDRLDCYLINSRNEQSMIDGDDRIRVEKVKKIRNNLESNLKRYIRTALEKFSTDTGKEVNCKKIAKIVAAKFSKLLLDSRIDNDNLPHLRSQLR